MWRGPGAAVNLLSRWNVRMGDGAKRRQGRKKKGWPAQDHTGRQGSWCLDQSPGNDPLLYIRSRQAREVAFKETDCSLQPLIPAQALKGQKGASDR